MTVVKICGITNAEDALACVKAGADALGFNFWPHSSRYLPVAEARTIIERLPETVMTVGVFVNEPGPDQVRNLATAAGVCAVQLHGDESPEYCTQLQDYFVIKAFRLRQAKIPDSLSAYETEAVLLDAFDPFSQGGTGQTIDWTVARRVRAQVNKLFLAGGLSPENVTEAVRVVEPYAVDACSSLEERPGKKDHVKVREFVTALRLAC